MLRGPARASPVADWAEEAEAILPVRVDVFLETERLLLRRLTMGDVDNVVEPDGDAQGWLTGRRSGA